MGSIETSNKTFRLSDEQEVKLKEWQDKIKDLFGEYGHYDYKFTPFGMMTGLEVTSHLTRTTIDLTEEE